MCAEFEDSRRSEKSVWKLFLWVDRHREEKNFHTTHPQSDMRAARWHWRSKQQVNRSRLRSWEFMDGQIELSERANSVCEKKQQKHDLATLDWISKVIYFSSHFLSAHTTSKNLISRIFLIFSICRNRTKYSHSLIISFSAWCTAHSRVPFGKFTAIRLMFLHFMVRLALVNLRYSTRDLL